MRTFEFMMDQTKDKNSWGIKLRMFLNVMDQKENENLWGTKLKKEDLWGDQKRNFSPIRIEVHSDFSIWRDTQSHELYECAGK